MFLAAVQAGASDRAAAAEAGISLETLHRWRVGERPFDASMRRQVARAHAIRERRWVESIQDASVDRTVQSGNQQRFIPKDWKAAAWLLERTNPDWAPPTHRTEISGGSTPVRVEESIEHRLALPDAERMKAVAGLLVRAGALPRLETKEEANGNGNGSGHDGS